jgi:hypothetical protein
VDHQRTVRRLRDLLEPIAASVYFAPECHANYEALGYGPSAGDFGGVAAPNQVAYFWSRGAALGDVPGETIAAAFAVFNPDVVVPLVAEARAIATRDQILAARLDGQRDFLQRVISPAAAEGVERVTEVLRRLAAAGRIAGHHLYAGLRSLGYPGDPMGDLWRAADLVREHRGDCHIGAWTSTGLSGPEIMLLTELWWGIPPRTYALSRGWTTEQFDVADQNLAAAGYVAGGQLTDEGRGLRRAIEDATDWQEGPVADELAGDANELFALLAPIVADIVTHRGYPPAAFMTEADLTVL